MLSRTVVRLFVVLALAAGTGAQAFQGPYASVVTGPGGFALDLDVRWPDGAAPPGGWPVVFWAHGAGGDKTSLAGNAQSYANDGYVTLTWTGRDTATAPTPSVLAGDVVALKSWVVNDFQQVQAGETLKAKAIVSGKGENLADATLPLPLPRGGAAPDQHRLLGGHLRHGDRERRDDLQGEIG